MLVMPDAYFHTLTIWIECVLTIFPRFQWRIEVKVTECSLSNLGTPYATSKKCFLPLTSLHTYPRLRNLHGGGRGTWRERRASSVGTSRVGCVGSRGPVCLCRPRYLSRQWPWQSQRARLQGEWMYPTRRTVWLPLVKVECVEWTS
jgi:hypothetical protein